MQQHLHDEEPQRTQPSVPPALVVVEAASDPVSQQVSALTDYVNQRLSQASRKEAASSEAPPFLLLYLLIATFMAIFLNGVAEGAEGVCFLSGIVLALMVSIQRLMTRLDRSRAALGLAEFDLRWIGPLALALEWPNARIRSIAALKLIQLLPYLTAGDAGLLNEHQRASLYIELLTGRNAELKVAILRAFEEVGGAEALPYVRRLAKKWPRTPGQVRVRNAARACLSVLEHRLKPGSATPAVQAPALDHEAEALDQESSALEAQEEAETTSPEARAAAARVEELLSTLEAERRKHQPGMRRGFLIASWLSIVPYTATMAYANWAHGHLPLALLWTGLCAGSTQLHRFCLSSRQSDAARKLANYDDIKGIGALAEMLDWPDDTIRQAVILALLRLLPRLQASDAQLLNRQQRASLYRMLKKNYTLTHTELQRKILKALEQVGDKAAVPYVKALASMLPLHPRQKQVHKAAEECLIYLEAQVNQQQMSQTLLRASSVETAPSELLLRAVSGPQESAPEQLLRPGPVDSEEVGR